MNRSFRAARKSWAAVAITPLAVLAVPAMATAARAGDDVSAAAARTVNVSTEAQLTSAIGNALPGDNILLSAGTYSGVLNITKSGTSASPITMRPAGNGPVNITASLPMPSCGASGPDENRTIRFNKGASYWTLSGLNIRGGVMISSANASSATKWLNAQFSSKNWQARRAVPGRSKNDPVAARSAAAYLSAKVGHTIVPSDGLSFISNNFTLKGLHSRFSRYGTFQNNTVSGIACGTGPGVWLVMYSDGWRVTGNSVTGIAHSTASHYMQEGIRIGGASAYNVVDHNRIYNLPTGGRAFTTDQDASFNQFTYNTADGVDIGFNDEMSGWGNNWSYNTATNYTTAGFSYRMMDGPMKAPSMNSSPNAPIIKCNTASGSRDFQAGALISATIQSNSFHTVNLGKNLMSYFGAQGNKWNGSSQAPGSKPAVVTTGC